MSICFLFNIFEILNINLMGLGKFSVIYIFFDSVIGLKYNICLVFQFFLEIVELIGFEISMYFFFCRVLYWYKLFLCLKILGYFLFNNIIYNCCFVFS